LGNDGGWEDTTLLALKEFRDEVSPCLYLERQRPKSTFSTWRHNCGGWYPLTSMPPPGVHPSPEMLMKLFEHLRTLQHVLIDYVPP
jgi:hypothetical protein